MKPRSQRGVTHYLLAVQRRRRQVHVRKHYSKYKCDLNLGLPDIDYL